MALWFWQAVTPESGGVYPPRPVLDWAVDGEAGAFCVELGPVSEELLGVLLSSAAGVVVAHGGGL
ncbi:MAG: hypothetical protein ABW137_20085 [Mycobacterium sp.]